MLAALAMGFVGSACVAEDMGGGLDIVNETDSTLVVFQHPIPANGGRFRYETTDCSARDLAAETQNGTVVAELTEKWCPGQVWTITGNGEGNLASG
jgi:hypothetical protein